MNAFGAYSIVAGVGGLFSFLIAFVALKTLSVITDAGMFGVAAMTAAPAIMAGVIAHFIHQSHQVSASAPRAASAPPQVFPQARRPEESFPPEGAYAPKGPGPT